MKNQFEITKELIEKGNVKEIHDLLYHTSRVGEISETIIDFCKDCSTSFVSDICKRTTLDDMSEKQVWCISYEVIKIKHMFDVWVEKNNISIEDLGFELEDMDE